MRRRLFQNWYIHTKKTTTPTLRNIEYKINLPMSWLQGEKFIKYEINLEWKERNMFWYKFHFLVDMLYTVIWWCCLLRIWVITIWKKSHQSSRRPKTALCWIWQTTSNFFWYLKCHRKLNVQYTCIFFLSNFPLQMVPGLLSDYVIPGNTIFEIIFQIM